MNITRFKWPVIIAAGLHGALFIPFHTDAIALPKPDEPPPLKPIPTAVDFMEPEEVEVTGTPAGGADPLPSIPDPLVPPVIDSPFVVPPTERSVPDKSIVDLKNHRMDGVTGPGEGMKFEPPSISVVGSLDRVPRAMAQPTPRYPNTLRAERVDGEATVEFVVGTDGHVISAEAVRWTHREFATAAVEAVLRWKFEPGTVHGRKVRFRMAIPIQFSVAS